MLKGGCPPLMDVLRDRGNKGHPRAAAPRANNTGRTRANRFTRPCPDAKEDKGIAVAPAMRQSDARPGDSANAPSHPIPPAGDELDQTQQPHYEAPDPSAPSPLSITAPTKTLKTCLA